MKKDNQIVQKKRRPNKQHTIPMNILIMHNEIFSANTVKLSYVMVDRELAL